MIKCYKKLLPLKELGKGRWSQRELDGARVSSELNIYGARESCREKERAKEGYMKIQTEIERDRENLCEVGNDKETQRMIQTGLILKYAANLIELSTFHVTFLNFSYFILKANRRLKVY